MRKKAQTIFLRTIVCLAATLVICTLVLLVGNVLVKGIPYLSRELFYFRYTSENHSVFPAAVTTLLLTFLSLITAIPLGIFSAIYLVEYANQSHKLITVIRIMTETLSGIPSIIYGLFGHLIFVVFFGWGYSLLAGACTVTIMVLPVIIRTTEEALRAIPASCREGSFGLGAEKLRTVFKILLPSASPGIFAGIVLAVGRIVGETAALLYTAGTVAQIPDSLTSSGRTLAIHMYALWNEGMAQGKAYATAIILLVVVAGLNGLSSFAAKHIMKGKTHE